MFEGKVLNLVDVGLWNGMHTQLSEDLHQNHAEEALDSKLHRRKGGRREERRMGVEVRSRWRED